MDEAATLEEVQEKQPLFFSATFGEDETFDMYRGFLIVQHTVEICDEAVRRTVVYIFDKNAGTLCISSGSRVVDRGDAEDLVDRVISGGEFWYGM